MMLKMKKIIFMLLLGSTASAPAMETYEGGEKGGKTPGVMACAAWPGRDAAVACTIRAIQGMSYLTPEECDGLVLAAHNAVDQAGLDWLERNAEQMAEARLAKLPVLQTTTEQQRDAFARLQLREALFKMLPRVNAAYQGDKGSQIE